MPINTTPFDNQTFNGLTTTGQPVDLVDGQTVNSVLAAGNLPPTPAQAAILALLITAASREITRYLGRQLGPFLYDEIVTPEGGRQDRGEPAAAKLSYFPVQSLTRVATGRATVLTVVNSDQTTNQFASAAFAVTGDAEYLDLTYTGLALSRTASGVTTTSTLDFGTYATVGALAAAIRGLGGGWTSAVASTGQPNPGLLATTELVGVREPKNAFSPGAALDAFTSVADSYDIDRATGIMRCYGWGGLGWGGGGGAWGPAFGSPYDGLGDWGGGTLGWTQYRVTYTAGLATVPESVQLICAEVVKLMLARLISDPALKSENTGKYSWVARDALGNLSPEMRLTLDLYKDNWV